MTANLVRLEQSRTGFPVFVHPSQVFCIFPTKHPGASWVYFSEDSSVVVGMNPDSAHAHIFSNNNDVGLVRLSGGSGGFMFYVRKDSVLAIEPSGSKASLVRVKGRTLIANGSPAEVFGELSK